MDNDNYREKKPEYKRENLIRLGVPYGKAYAFSRTRKGGWAIAQSPILNTTITLERPRKRGYESMEVYYQKVGPMFNCLSRFWAGNRSIRDLPIAIGISGVIVASDRIS